MGLFKVSAPLILAASLLSSVAQAAPAPRAVKPRDYVTNVVTRTIWTTTDITITVYVDELPSTSAPASTPATVTPSAPKIESSSSSTSGSSSSSAAAAAPPPPASAPQAQSSPSSPAGEFVEISAPPAPVYTPPPAPSAPASNPPAAPAPEPEPAPAPAPAPAAAPSPASYVADTAGSTGGSETANCESGSSCKGEITWYEGGLGACGFDVNTESEMAIALPFEFMGPLSNSNPLCGKSVTVKNPVTGTTVQGTVRDKCMGCFGRAIDLTHIMFNAVTDGNGDGREENFEWWFN